MYKYLLDIPNLITLTGLCMSFYACSILQTDLQLAYLMINLALICDNFDGFIARKLNRTDERLIFGGHLDCYADFITKGVFPSLLVCYYGKNNILAIVNIISIAIRYSYEFSDPEKPGGLSPDFSVITGGIIYILFFGTAYFNEIIQLNVLITCIFATCPMYVYINKKKQLMMCMCLVLNSIILYYL